MIDKGAVAMSGADIDESDVASVARVLRSGLLALGPQAQEFERMICDRVGARHAIAVSSGTAGLHLVARALGIGMGDEVIVPSFTFAASVNAILYEGADPVFVDVEPDTYNVDPEGIAARVTGRTAAIMAVDVFGHAVDWDAISQVSERHGLPVIDDSCEALGSEFRGRPVGSFGAAAVFAFYPNKQITTGEGGMVVTNDDELARTIRSMRNQGRGLMGAWLTHEQLGFNYRMDEMSAALGASQMRRFDSLLAKRTAVAERYNQLLGECDWVRLPVVRPHVKMSWFVYVVTLDSGINRDLVMRLLEDEGIPTRAYFPPIHEQPYLLERFTDRHWNLPVTADIARRTLALPFHNNLTHEDAERVVTSLVDAVARVG